MQFETVVWPVQPGAEAGSTRPARLIAAMQKIGTIRVDQAYSHGRPFRGRSSAVVDSNAAIRIASPWFKPPETHGGSALLTPLVLFSSTGPWRWVDAYDDWSVAPDVPWLGRRVAQISYRRLRQRSSLTVVTANTPYMAARLGTPHLVPNGVDTALSTLPHSGDDSFRVLILGSLHRGRVSSDTLNHLSRLEKDVHVVIAGPATDSVLSAALASEAQVEHHDFLHASEIAAMIGRRTVALLPLEVSDYTLSQDPMKLYEFLALGLPIVMPRMLWPRHLPLERFMLYDYEDDVRDLLRRASELSTEGSQWRRTFASANSWERRARHISAILEVS